ncbi:hypothetical protein CK910_08540 [Aeromonas sp. CA23]|uniref:DUF6402 family protein n=1 Tax=Aeromonas sp. CA23 TaxID=2033032 RepID=UPI000BFD03D7|nr:DUF6402 family protein [Aeromonas sp. CA23]ATL98522.1 hypothetical protein CK910_08540 [Aeromonas sp. CA23]
MPGTLNVPLEFAKRAALEMTAIRWNKTDPAVDLELPLELRTDRKLMLIYCLPKILAGNQMDLASKLAWLWQYGKKKDFAEGGGFKHDRVWRIQVKHFSDRSETVRFAIDTALSDTETMLKTIATKEAYFSEEFAGVRKFIDACIKNNSQKSNWSVEVPLQNYSSNPEIFIKSSQINTFDYLQQGEYPTISDAYAAIGPFGIRKYVIGTLYKAEKNNAVWLRPSAVAVRLVDDYDFSDDGSATNLAARIAGWFLTGQLSQYLGAWAEKGGSELTTLSNADFQRYASEFAPKYNAWLDNCSFGRSRLECVDFSSVSDFVTRKVKEIDYQIPL